jgi:hypothetical protein
MRGKPVADTTGKRKSDVMANVQLIYERAKVKDQQKPPLSRPSRRRSRAVRTFYAFKGH